jgi:succinate-acetate transporter protein
MTSTSSAPPADGRLPGTSAGSRPGTPAVPSPLHGSPGIVGIPITIVGALGLGIVDAGLVPAAAASAGLPIILTATATGLLLATIWAAALGQNASASLFAVFFGFYGSYAALALGLVHGWYGIPASQAAHTEAVWLVCWLVTIGMLTVLTLRLPWSFPLLLGLVDIALALLLAGTLAQSTLLTHAGGYVVFGFVAVAIYLYADLMWSETGGSRLPLGRALIT